MTLSRKFHRPSVWLALLALALVTMGGTCVVVEEGPYGEYEDPGINADRMEEQEAEVMEEEDR